MNALNSSIKPQIKKICGKLVLFEINRNEYAWASRRVANDILNGVEPIFYDIQSPLPTKGEFGEPVYVNTYLATPSVW